LIARHLEILQHCLGVDEYGRTPKGFTPYTRNYFCAGEGDESDCRELVALGYMVQLGTTEYMPYFNCSVTDAGKKAMHRESPNPPKLSRSQMRYRRFCDADSGMSFRDWIRYEQDSRFKV
jgi:hypothetical protein